MTQQITEQQITEQQAAPETGISEEGHDPAHHDPVHRPKKLELKKPVELDRAVALGQLFESFLKDGLEESAALAAVAAHFNHGVGVARRRRRIARLNHETIEVLRGTWVAKRQDLLLQLVATYGDHPVLAQREAAQALIDAPPPKYGPRSIPKEAPAGAPSLPTAALKTVVFDGLPISMEFDDGEPRVRDIELATYLGYDRPRNIRKLIKELVDGHQLELEELRMGQRFDAKRGPRTGSPLGENWLTEEQALFVTSQAGTPRAREITRKVIRAFMAARRERISGAQDAGIMALLTDLTQKVGALRAQLDSREYAPQSFLLVPHVRRDRAGWSMEALTGIMVKRGFALSEGDTAVRSIAAQMGIIGDERYGFWNAHNDTLNRPLSEHWRFNEEGCKVLYPHLVSYCERRKAYEEEKVKGARQKALEETLNGINSLPRVGNSDMVFLTRTLPRQPQDPFPAPEPPEPIEPDHEHVPDQDSGTAAP